MEEKYGIENLKKLVIWIASLADSIIDSILDDGKIKYGEIFEIAFKAISIPVKTFKSLDEELMNLSDEERIELITTFSEKFEISNEEAEVKVEQALDFLLSLLVIFTNRKETIEDINI